MDAIESSLSSQSHEMDQTNSKIKLLESQISELKIQLELKDVKYKHSLADLKFAMQNIEKLQVEVEHYFLLSLNQQQIIKELEQLQLKSNSIIANSLFESR